MLETSGTAGSGRVGGHDVLDVRRFAEEECSDEPEGEGILQDNQKQRGECSIAAKEK